MWKKINVPTDKIPALIAAARNDVKMGFEVLEKMRYVFLLENSNIIHCLTPYDFLDNLTNDMKFKVLSVYQVLEN